MGSWLKVFEDNTKELGTDYQVDCGVSSWVKGRTHGIREVQISDSLNLISLSVPNTEWYQFDRCFFNPETSENSRVYRAIQAKIKMEHIGMYLVKENNGMFFFSVIINDEQKKQAERIEIDKLDLYCTVVLPLGTPYVTFCEKGRVKP